MHSTLSSSAKAIVAYVPALHAGYLSFFGKHPETPIFVLGRTFIDAYPRLNRDIRALEPQNAARALSALGFTAQVIEMNETDQLSEFSSIVLPDEDVSRDFADKYIKPDQAKLEY